MLPNPTVKVGMGSPPSAGHKCLRSPDALVSVLTSFGGTIAFFAVFQASTLDLEAKMMSDEAENCAKRLISPMDLEMQEANTYPAPLSKFKTELKQESCIFQHWGYFWPLQLVSYDVAGLMHGTIGILGAYTTTSTSETSC